jgi:hypothetical protein
MTSWNPSPKLTPAQRYTVTIARATLEAHQAHGIQAVARWNEILPGRVPVPDGADLPAGLVFAYEVAMRQIRQLLAIIDNLTGGSS